MMVSMVPGSSSVSIMMVAPSAHIWSISLIVSHTAVASIMSVPSKSGAGTHSMYISALTQLSVKVIPKSVARDRRFSMSASVLYVPLLRANSRRSSLSVQVTS